ncbi:hypothetical protein CC78DRAFT_574382 [Lojkania enalia]|uniref:Uncharacterized protein n=1 Tax=Lojkania enalia TaxID=147567 RepID=A0A9P4NBM4_9PLEO|nr:hypothetical protein CC78DRAFT_574382 [Didymosphaeria enalia]
MQFKTLAIPFVLMTAVLAAPAPQDSCPNVDSLHNILESTPGATEKFNELASGESTLTKRACLYDGCSECQLSCRSLTRAEVELLLHIANSLIQETAKLSAHR